MKEDNYIKIYEFLEKYLPNYYFRDDVLKSDILFRFLTNEELNEKDRNWIKDEFSNNIDLVKEECLKLDKIFLTEAIENFYKINFL